MVLSVFVGNFDLLAQLLEHPTVVPKVQLDDQISEVKVLLHCTRSAKLKAISVKLILLWKGDQFVHNGQI